MFSPINFHDRWKTVLNNLMRKTFKKPTNIIHNNQSNLDLWISTNYELNDLLWHIFRSFSLQCEHFSTIPRALSTVCGANTVQCSFDLFSFLVHLWNVTNDYIVDMDCRLCIRIQMTKCSMYFVVFIGLSRWRNKSLDNIFVSSQGGQMSRANWMCWLYSLGISSDVADTHRFAVQTLSKKYFSIDLCFSVFRNFIRILLHVRFRETYSSLCLFFPEQSRELIDLDMRRQ